MVSSILRGVWLGFSIAAPVGPIGVLVLKRALQSGRWAGIRSGFGAALADLIYGFLAVAGVRLAAGYSRGVAIAGGSVLLWLAWRSWKERPRADGDGEAEERYRGTLATFLLTLSNPMTILSFAAMVASAGADAPALFVVGVFSGSMLWWVVLSIGAAAFRPALEGKGIALNRLAAVTLGCFGLWALLVRAS